MFPSHAALPAKSLSTVHIMKVMHVKHTLRAGSKPCRSAVQIAVEESGRSQADDEAIARAVVLVPAGLWAAVAPQLFSLLHHQQVR
jgi:hypothetical protein